jgi:hypothetical protein
VHQEGDDRSSKGLASSCRAPPTSKETDPGWWWVPAEVSRYPRTVVPFLHCTRDMVVRYQARTMYVEPIKDRRLRRDVRCNLNAIVA